MTLTKGEQFKVVLNMAQPEEYALIGTSNASSIERVLSNDRGSAGGSFFEIYDDTETDITFMRRLYRNADKRYVLGAWMIKAITEVLLRFMGVPEASSKDNKLQKDLANFYNTNHSHVVQLLRELGLYGRTYAVIGWDNDLKIPTLSVKNKSSIVDIRYEDIHNPRKVTYVRVREITRFPEKTDDYNDVSQFDTKEHEVIYDKIFWMDLNNSMDILESKNDDNSSKYFYKLLRKSSKKARWEVVIAKKPNPWKCIPVIEFNQSVLSDDLAGYGDTSGIIPLIGAYHQILENAIDSNIYNGRPTMIFKGLSNSAKFINQMYGEIDINSGDTIQQGFYDVFGSYYLEGDADVKYLAGPEVAAEAKELLKLLFYICLQVSGVPEWSLGAQMNTTYASTKMQSIPLAQKIESKRNDIKDSLVELHNVIAHIYEVMDNKKYSTYLATPSWSETMPDDKAYLIQAVELGIQSGLLSKETALQLLDIVDDPTSEIEKYKKEYPEIIKQQQELGVMTNLNKPTTEVNNVHVSPNNNNQTGRTRRSTSGTSFSQQNRYDNNDRNY